MHLQGLFILDEYQLLVKMKVIILKKREGRGGRGGVITNYQLPITHSQCPMPHAHLIIAFYLLSDIERLQLHDGAVNFHRQLNLL